MSSISQFWCNVIHCKSAYKNRFHCYLCSLYAWACLIWAIFFKKIADLEDILCLLVEFCVPSEIHLSKTRFKQINEDLRPNVYARMLWEPVYKISYLYLHKKLRKIGRFTCRFFKFSCESVFTRKRNPSHDLLSSFLSLIWVYQYLFNLWKHTLLQNKRGRWFRVQSLLRHIFLLWLQKRKLVFWELLTCRERNCIQWKPSLAIIVSSLRTY